MTNLKFLKNARLLIFTSLLFILNQKAFSQACSPAIAAPTLSANSAVLKCPSLTADLNVLVSSTTPPDMTLEWHTVATNPTAANLVTMPTSSTGIHYAYYHDDINNCYSPATAAVSVTNPAIGAPVATVSNNTFCTGTNGSITLRSNSIN
ncbi:MAG: hypothetical protein R2831_10685 [Chitinophagaceae bacterium]